MVFYSLAFLLGDLLVQQLAELPSLPYLLAGLAITGVLIWRRLWIAVFFVVGMIWAVAFAIPKKSAQLPEQLAGIDIQVSGIIADLPTSNDQRTRFDLMIKDSSKPIPSKLKLSWYHAESVVKAGQHWSFTVKLKQPHSSLNPGGFDYERWLFSEGIGATGYVRSYPKPMLLGEDSPWLNISIWRQAIADHLSQRLGQNQTVALLKALTIGEGSDISQQQWEVFRKTGTIHLIVISGSHIALVAGLVYWLVLKLWAHGGYLSWSPQKVAALAAMLTGVAYAGLAGFSIPTQRAAVMLIIAMLSIISQRNIRPLHTLSLAIIAVLLIDPLAVLSAGFWLSFLAVVAIIYIVSGRLGKPAYFSEMIRINWATSLGLAPLLLLFFQQLSIISPLANLVAVPVISVLIVPFALVAVVILFIWPPFADQLLFLLEGILQSLYWFLEWIAVLPEATINLPQPSFLATAFALPGVLLLLAPKGIPARWLGLVMLLPLAFPELDKPAAGTIRMTLLDVGQGLSVVVQTKDHWLVYDTGAKFSNDSDIGQSVIVPFLRYHGVSNIDHLVISHGDNDHIGGTDSLLKEIPAEKVFSSVPEQLERYQAVACHAGESWQWDKVKFTMLAPPTTAFVSDNNNSCVLKIQAESASFLLTGDIEAEAEDWLVGNYGDELKADLLIAPHHGSKTSSTRAFLQQVHPRYILIPAGFKNQFGHPHPSVLARYQELNANWLNTANSGAILVDSANQKLSVESYRKHAARYWQQQ